MIKMGNAVFSPIAHSHALVEHGLPIDWSFWEQHDRHHLTHCDEVVVLMPDGWEASVGVRGEVRIAKEMNKPVRYTDIARLLANRTTSEAVSDVGEAPSGTTVRRAGATPSRLFQ